MRLLRQTFRYVHIGWALLVLAGCVALVLMGGGHPPPMAFVPHLLAAGILGHLLLLLVAWLAGLGVTRAGAAGSPAAGWPVEAGIVALVLGGLALAATVITIGEIARLRTRPLEWSLMAAIAAAHGAAFVALMLRRRAAGWLVAAIAAGWGVALALQLREARSPGELALAFLILAGLAAIAAWALRSRRLSAFLR
ncbi:MAG TPA: hypothetical protein VD701_07600 [Steroidobacteraceae bacterium]|nr:hypothetical protein [Steroidobacteraceae bacterium]